MERLVRLVPLPGTSHSASPASACSAFLSTFVLTCVPHGVHACILLLSFRHGLLPRFRRATSSAVAARRHRGCCRRVSPFRTRCLAAAALSRRAARVRISLRRALQRSFVLPPRCTARSRNRRFAAVSAERAAYRASTPRAASVRCALRLVPLLRTVTCRTSRFLRSLPNALRVCRNARCCYIVLPCNMRLHMVRLASLLHRLAFCVALRLRFSHSSVVLRFCFCLRFSLRCERVAPSSRFLPPADSVMFAVDSCLLSDFRTHRSVLPLYVSTRLFCLVLLLCSALIFPVCCCRLCCAGAPCLPPNTALPPLRPASSCVLFMILLPLLCLLHSL